MPQLRINLLPAYFAERRKTQGAILLWSLVFAAALIGPLVWYLTLLPQVVKREEEATQMQQEAQRVTAYKAATQQIRDQIQPIKDKVDYVEGVRFYNGWRQKIYRRAAQYTLNEVEYNSMAVAGNALSVNGYVRNASDLGRYLITFFGNPDVNAVSISGPPGWNPQQQQVQPPTFGQPRPREGFPFTVTATLIRSLQLPPLPASLNQPVTPAGAAPAAGGFPGAGGAPPVAAPAPGPPSDAGGGGGADADDE